MREKQKSCIWIWPLSLTGNNFTYSKQSLILYYLLPYVMNGLLIRCTYLSLASVLAWRWSLEVFLTLWHGHFPCCRPTETQFPCISFSHCSLFPLHCQEDGSRLWCILTVQINKKRRVSRSLRWVKSIGSNEDGNQQEWEKVGGSGKMEVERAVGNQVSHQLHVKLTGTLFPWGNEFSGTQWGLISSDWSMH